MNKYTNKYFLFSILIILLIPNIFLFTLTNDELVKILEDVYDAHDRLRKKHDADELSVSDDLEEIAQEYADKMAKNHVFEHSHNTYEDSPLGENLYKVTNAVNFCGECAVNDWYAEIIGYNFNNPGYVEGLGHFTQLVWKSSKKIGCGVSEADGIAYLVCNYYPAGNVNTAEEFANNVSYAWMFGNYWKRILLGLIILVLF